ncbi:hypothetical protein ABEB36_004891 [Hypothenemus hampei]|uniref:N-acetyllactosaminide beta-1,3-N-acetylglucosaminyltransferase n=1 Tax=Hypothenemus hampei TaxID=57062 RepID=A0ABD1EW73_HYPHA
MGILRRLRDCNSFCFILLGCILTSIYFALLNNSINTGTDHNHFSSNGQCKEICRNCKFALSEKKFEDDFKDMEPMDILTENVEFPSLFRCNEGFGKKTVSQRGNYYVIYNFVQAERQFKCMESITLSAPGDFRFLDNIIPLTDSWTGPISVALYAPGNDFYTTLNTIAYLRVCQSEIIKQLVSFHLIFDQAHTPDAKDEKTILDAYEEDYDCHLPPPWQTVADEEMYKTQHNLLYPINLVRNVAKLAAETYFVFPSDIELYPTKNFIPKFLQLVKNNLDLFKPGTRNVFVLPIFEILVNATIPQDKTKLLQMLKDKTAIIFHQSVCVVCHRVIESEKWVKTKETEGLNVFSVGKRSGRYMVWEPFFVCTQNEPLWDERMTWEGQSNKMVQAYTMCVMNYDFHVLDNAFLIHKPGVKKKKVQMLKFKDVVKNSTKLIFKIGKELQNLYGNNSNCSTVYRSVMGKTKGKEKPLLKKTDLDVAQKVPQENH